VLEVLYQHAKFSGARISPAAGAPKNVEFFWPDCKPEGPLFLPAFVCLCVCLKILKNSQKSQFEFQSSGPSLFRLWLLSIVKKNSTRFEPN